ncbi:MAG TPA: DUF948 domain-containing protein [Actinomycetota bacterium]|nr:DUF948 domain-containing protein [Actinomycetota bacterium]
MTWGQAAALIAALAFVALVAFLAMVLAKIGAILSEVQMTLNDVRKETMPLLKEVRTTVVTLNVEMDRVDGIMASAESAAASVSNVAKLVTSATANPIIKGMAFLTGAGVSLRSLRRKGGKPDEE